VSYAVALHDALIGPVRVKFRHCSDVRCMTALAPKAEVHPRSCYVGEVPIAATPDQYAIGRASSTRRAIPAMPSYTTACSIKVRILLTQPLSTEELVLKISRAAPP
jgi:hypothetical protein